MCTSVALNTFIMLCLSGLIQYSSFCVWLILLSIVFSGVTRVVPYFRISLHFVAEEYCTVYIVHFVYPVTHRWSAVSTVGDRERCCRNHWGTRSASLLSVLSGAGVKQLNRTVAPRSTFGGITRLLSTVAVPLHFLPAVTSVVISLYPHQLFLSVVPFSL